MKLSILFLLFIFIWTSAGNAQESRYWDSLKYVLTCESASKTASIPAYEKKYKGFLSEIQQAGIEPASVRKFHKMLFGKFQNAFCGKYVADSQLHDIFDNMNYNCANAALLYASFAKECGADIHMFMTPTHVFLGYEYDGSFYPIELVDPESGLTSPDDIEAEVDAMVKDKLITKSELKTKGYYRAYIEDVRGASEIDFKKLQSLELINYYYDLYKQKDYKRCYALIDTIIPLSNDTLTQTLFWVSCDAMVKDAPKDMSVQKTVLGKLFSVRDTSEKYRDVLFDILSTAGTNLIKGKEFVFLDSMLLAVHNAYPAFAVDDSRYQIVCMGLYSEQASETKLKGDYLGAFSVIRKLYCALPQLSQIKAYYCENSVFFVSQAINLDEFENALLIADSLNKDIPGPNCLPPKIIEQAKLGVLDYFRDLGEDRLKEKEIFYKGKRAAYPDDTLFTFMCKTVCRSKSMRAVKANDWNKAREMAAEALQQFPSDPLIKEEANMIEEQYKGYLKYKKYIEPGRKTK